VAPAYRTTCRPYSPARVPRDIVRALLALLVAVVLLSANEMFGQPPLMTPPLHPSADLVGSAWTQTAPVDVALTIHDNASVTGTISGTEITAARVSYGRSWFGRLLHWNADYVIGGRIQNRDFAAPLMAATTGLIGSLFREGRPAPLELTKR
jgi:hypothetical protein